MTKRVLVFNKKKRNKLVCLEDLFWGKGFLGVSNLKVSDVNRFANTNYKGKGLLASSKNGLDVLALPASAGVFFLSVSLFSKIVKGCARCWAVMLIKQLKLFFKVCRKVALLNLN